MKYEKNLAGDRYKIVNKGTFGIENIVTSNLSENEIMITVLEAFDCPIGKNCIDLIKDGPKDDVTSICKFLGPYPVMHENEHLSEKIDCLYNGKIVRKNVRRLHAKVCCGYHTRCADCDRPEDPFVPTKNDLGKSHAFLLCKQTEMKT